MRVVTSAGARQDRELGEEIAAVGVGAQLAGTRRLHHQRSAGVKDEDTRHEAHATNTSEDALVDLDGVAGLERDVGELAVGDVVHADGGRHGLARADEAREPDVVRVGQ